MSKQMVIFDFDGTLADTLPVVIEIAEEVGGVSVAPKEIEELRNLPPLEVMRYLGIPYYKIPGLLFRGKQLLSKRLAEVNMFDGMPEVLKNLHDAGYTLCLVSSNSASNIRSILQKTGTQHYFDCVYGNVGVFNKAGALKKAVRRQRAERSQTIYVGDEVRDIEASKKSGLQIISVSWGYNGEKILRKYQPDYIAKSPKDLQEIILGQNRIL